MWMYGFNQRLPICGARTVYFGVTRTKLTTILLQNIGSKASSSELFGGEQILIEGLRASTGAV